ncbi:MAG TPA: MASE1 domain-containing protein, partial [Candidatus Thermoplasmatota archaeon]|nr:MASE1 domain-containing protein [Candidatus Thermoplasmatota archaeon]
MRALPAGWAPWLPAEARDAARAAVLLLAYVAAGKAGLSLASVHPSATAVWAPTGIAIAALLVWGPRVWPGVLAGAFVVNATTTGTWATSLGIAAGNTLEGLAAAWLVARLAHGPAFVERARDVLAFAGLAALACLLSATIGVTTLALGGFAAWPTYADIWATWWLGDVAGAVVVAPFVVAWAPRWRALTLREAQHAGLLVVASGAVGVVLFAGLSPAQVRDWPLEFLVIPLVVLAAYLEGPLGVATATVVLSAVAVGGTVQGFGPFGDAGPRGLVPLQGFMAAASLTGLALAAVVREREGIAAELRRARDDLEERVAERTASLERAIAALRREASEHERAQATLAEREAQLAQAQRTAGLGSWTWDVARDEV